MKRVLAIVFSDLHINDWSKFNQDNKRTQDHFRVLSLIKEACLKYECPALFCGDLFHKPENISNSLLSQVFGAFDKLNDKFDIVFSNACIQWIPNHEKLLADIMNILNDGGIMAIQTPMNYKEPIHRIIEELVSSDKWKKYFPNPREFYNLKQEEYFDLLSKISSSFTIWETVYCHRMPSHESIMEWYRSTGLRPYLSALSGKKAKELEKDVFEEVQKEYPIQENGEIIFRFPRFFFIATK